MFEKHISRRKLNSSILVILVMTVCVIAWATPFRVPRGTRALVFSPDGEVLGIFPSGINIKPLLAEITLWPATTTHLVSLEFEAIDYDGSNITIKTSVWLDLSKTDLIKAERTVGTSANMDQTIKVWLINEGKKVCPVFSLEHQGAKGFEDEWREWFMSNAGSRLKTFYNIQIVDVVVAITPRSK